jgi:hypothetical protein
VTGLLLDRGLPVRAMVRREDDRAAALRAAGAEVVVGDLLEPADVYRVVSRIFPPTIFGDALKKQEVIAIFHVKCRHVSRQISFESQCA